MKRENLTIEQPAPRVGDVDEACRRSPASHKLCQIPVFAIGRFHVQAARLVHPSRPDSELQPGCQGRHDRAQCPRAVESGGSSSTAAPTAAPNGCRRWPSATWAARDRAAGERGKGAAVLAGADAAAASGFTHVDDGFRRPASGRPDSCVHGRVAGRARRDGAGRAEVRRERAAVARAGAPPVERVGRPRDVGPGSAIRCTGLRIRSRRWPRSCAASRGCAASTSIPRRPCGCVGRRAADRIDAPVRYFGRHEGGVSHFHYGRDNALLAWMHLRLFTGFAVWLPMLVARRLTRRHDQTA